MLELLAHIDVLSPHPFPLMVPVFVLFLWTRRRPRNDGARPGRDERTTT